MSNSEEDGNEEFNVDNLEIDGLMPLKFVSYPFETVQTVGRR